MGEVLSLADIMEKSPIGQVGEQWLAAAATLLYQQGDTEAAIAATDVLAVDLTLWNSNEYEPDEYMVYFTVEPNLVAQFTEAVLSRIEGGMHAVVPRRASMRIDSIEVSPVVPVPNADWRKQLRTANGPMPTNQARRVRLEPEDQHPIEDDLHFTNEWEHRVYQVLKERQAILSDSETIGIMPLGRMRLLDSTREPDFLVTYRGRAGAIEVDGPHHGKPGRASSDSSRDSLMINADQHFWCPGRPLTWPPTPAADVRTSADPERRFRPCEVRVTPAGCRAPGRGNVKHPCPERCPELSECPPRRRRHRGRRAPRGLDR